MRRKAVLARICCVFQSINPVIASVLFVLYGLAHTTFHVLFLFLFSLSFNL